MGKRATASQSRAPKNSDRRALGQTGNVDLDRRIVARVELGLRQRRNESTVEIGPLDDQRTAVHTALSSRDEKTIGAPFLRRGRVAPTRSREDQPDKRYDQGGERRNSQCVPDDAFCGGGHRGRDVFFGDHARRVGKCCHVRSSRSRALTPWLDEWNAGSRKL